MKLGRNQRNETVLMIFVVGIPLLMIMRDVEGFSFNKYIFVMYSAGLMCIADYETLISMLAFMFPLLWGLPGTYIMMFALVLLVVKAEGIDRRTVFMIMFFSILELSASFWYPRWNAIEIAGYLFSLSIFFILLNSREKIDYMRCVKLFFYGATILCLIIVVSGLKKAPSNWRYLFSRGWFRFGETQAGSSGGMTTSVNANTLAYYSITGICCGLVVLKREKGLRRIAVLVSIALLVVSGFLSVSRSWLLIALICTMLYMACEAKSPKGALCSGAAVIAGALAALNYSKNNPELLQGLLQRLNDSGMNTAGGRVELFQLYLEEFLKTPRFFIMGTGTAQYKEVTCIFDSIHNGLEQILVCYGLAGGIVFLDGLMHPVCKMRGVRKPFVYWIPLIGCVLFTQTIQFVNPDALMFPYMIAVYALRAGGEESG